MDLDEGAAERILADVMTAALPPSGPYRELVALADGRILVVTGEVVALFQ